MSNSPSRGDTEAAHRLCAALYAGAVEEVSQLQEAMSSRAVIEQAKGIIMAERRCDPDEAFSVLVRASQDSNRKVRDVAADLDPRAWEVLVAERRPRPGGGHGDHHADEVLRARRR